MNGPLGALLGLGVAFGALALVMIVWFFVGYYTKRRGVRALVYGCVALFPCAVIVGYVVGATS